LLAKADERKYNLKKIWAKSCKTTHLNGVSLSPKNTFASICMLGFIPVIKTYNTPADG
jgi:hypothetical protein